jgi:hypothetical protein
MIMKYLDSAFVTPSDLSAEPGTVLLLLLIADRNGMGTDE